MQAPAWLLASTHSASTAQTPEVPSAEAPKKRFKRAGKPVLEAADQNAPEATSSTEAALSKQSKKSGARRPLCQLHLDFGQVAPGAFMLNGAGK